MTVPSPKSCPGKKSLMCAQLLAILQAMSAASWMVAALRSALCPRRDLLLEILALRRQVGVLGRSDRRFRPSDRLAVRVAFVATVEGSAGAGPATVARWHREGFRGCWSRRSRRRLGRPFIDSQLRALI